MGDVSTEPTMEEILSSIKRVIEESETTSAPSIRARRSVRAAPPPPPAIDEDEDDEVLELSERVPFAPMPRRDEPSMPTPTPAAKPEPEPILSAVTAEASRGALDMLSRLVVKPDIAGTDTLEGLVREMLRPMLRDWLDANLPQIVETMVAKEIARIAGRNL
jgi:hypothetical protein